MLLYQKLGPIVWTLKGGTGTERENGGPGWLGIGPETGRFVPEQEGFLTACAGCGIRRWDPEAPEAAEFYGMLVEWYFSGNWIWKEDVE